MYWENPPPNANVMPCPYQPGDSFQFERDKHLLLDPLIWDPEEI